MPAFIVPLVVDKLGICSLSPAPWSRIEFVREDAHGNRDGDAFRIEIPFAPILPIETGARKRRVRQPGDRDVIKDVIAKEDTKINISGTSPNVLAVSSHYQTLNALPDRP